MYFELFVAAALMCTGEIVFGRFEERSRGRRVIKMMAFFALTALISHYGGRTAAVAWVLGAFALALALHGWWTRRNGIQFLQPEPWDRYRTLRGWS